MSAHLAAMSELCSDDVLAVASAGSLRTGQTLVHHPARQTKHRRYVPCSNGYVRVWAYVHVCRHDVVMKN